MRDEAGPTTGAGARVTLRSLVTLALLLLACNSTSLPSGEPPVPGASAQESEGDVRLDPDAVSAGKTQEGLASLCPPLGSGEPTSALLLKVEHVSREQSKDSHTTRRRAEFDGRVLTYYGPYGACVRGRCRHAEVQLVLSDSESAELEAAVEKHGLWEGLTESKPRMGRGPSHTTSATIDLSDGARSARSSVWSGWWRSGDGRVEFGSTEARSRGSSIGTLARSLARVAQRCYPELR